MSCKVSKYDICVLKKESWRAKEIVFPNKVNVNNDVFKYTISKFGVSVKEFDLIAENNVVALHDPELAIGNYTHELMWESNGQKTLVFTGNLEITNTANSNNCGCNGSDVKTISVNTSNTTLNVSIDNLVVMGSGGGASYILPTASATVKGGVKIGANLSIDSNGVLSATASGSGIASIATDNTNKSVTFSGNGTTLTPLTAEVKIDGTTIVKSSNGTLSAVSSGSGSGMTPEQIAKLNTIDNKVDKVTGKSLIADTEITRLATLTNYTLPTATTAIKGGVKVDGTTITVNTDGVISSIGGGGNGVTPEQATEIAKIANKVDKVTNKSLILDSEITRLAGVTNYNDTAIKKTLSDIVEAGVGSNLFTGEIIEGSYLNTVGIATAAENSSITGLIPVKPNTYYYLSGRLASGGIACYAENKTTRSKVKSVTGVEYAANYYLPNNDGTAAVSNGAFLTSSTAAYLQVSLRYNSTKVDYDKIMLEEIGSTYNANFVPSPYIAPGVIVATDPKIKDSAMPNSYKSVVKKSIKVLFIGNSFTQNSVCYVPNLLKSISPDLEFTLAIAFIGGSPLAQHYANFSNTAQTIGETTYQPTTYSMFKNTNNTGWKSSSNKSIDTILAEEKWDIVTFQQGGNHSALAWETHYAPYIYKLHKLVGTKLGRSIRLGWLSIHGSYSTTTENLLNKWTLTTENSKKVMETTATSILFPFGTAVQNLRSTTAKDVGEGSAKNLTHDNAHLQSGLGELVACYSNTLTILNEVDKVNSKVVGNVFRPVKEDSLIKYDVLGVTDEYCYLAQISAIDAIKEPYKVTDLAGVETILNT